MSRLPYLRRDDLDEGLQGLWDIVVSSPEVDLVTEEGGLAGPFNAWMHGPAVGVPAAQLGAAVRFSTSLDRRLSEIAIITTGAAWRAEYEWWAHSAMAAEHGVSPEVIAAIAAGTPPPFEADDERTVYAAARQLAGTGSLDEATYASCQEHFGHAGTVELVTLCGYYTLICFTLNAFAVPLPPGAQPVFATPEAADGA